MSNNNFHTTNIFWFEAYFIENFIENTKLQVNWKLATISLGLYLRKVSSEAKQTYHTNQFSEVEWYVFRNKLEHNK